MSVMTVKNLTMTYKVPVRPAGLKASLQSLFKRQYRYVKAVEHISFTIGEGEVVGFLGPNGAGKTTTLKMLSGILHSSDGEAKVLGHIPWLREISYLKQIAFIRGSRPMSVPGELTVKDALLFQKKLYDVTDFDYRRNAAELVDMLDLESLLPRQVRALSLGEKMRSGLACSLLYRPKVLFLDEPTLGLDVTAVNAIRKFLKLYSSHTRATILLTSHYMADVEALCGRIILINKGELHYDGRLSALYDAMTPYKHLHISFTDTNGFLWEDIGDVIHSEDHSITLRIPKERITAVTNRILSSFSVHDLLVVEPPLEDVMEQIFSEGSIRK